MLKTNLAAIGAAVLVVTAVSAVGATQEPEQCAPQYVEVTKTKTIEVGTEYFHKHFLYAINGNTKWQNEITLFPWVYTGESRAVTQEVEYTKTVPNPAYAPECGQ